MPAVKQKANNSRFFARDQVQQTAVEPAHRVLATWGMPGKHPVPVNASMVTDRKGGGVDEADAGAVAQLRMQIGAPVGQEPWASTPRSSESEPSRGAQLAQMTLDVLGVIGFERAIVRLMKEDEDGHDLGFE